MAKRNATTDINHDNWDQEEEPEVAGTFQAAPAAVLATRVIKLANRRLDKSVSKDPVTLTNKAELEKSNKSDSKVGQSVFQNFGGFLPRPQQGNDQSTTMSFFGNTKHVSNTSMLSTTSSVFENSQLSNVKEPTSTVNFSVVKGDQKVVGDEDVIRPRIGTSAGRSMLNVKSPPNTTTSGYIAADRSKFGMNLNSTGTNFAVPDNTNKPLYSSTCLENKPGLGMKSVTESTSGLSSSAAMDKMDSRSLLKPVPDDILGRLRAKAVATSKSLNFLKRIYELNTTTTDWLNLLIQEDLTINISDVIPSYMQELLKLIDEEIAEQKSEAVKSALLPHQKQLQQMLGIFHDFGMVPEPEDVSSTKPESKNVSKSRPTNSFNFSPITSTKPESRNISKSRPTASFTYSTGESGNTFNFGPALSSSNSGMNMLQSSFPSTRLKTNQDAWQATKEKQDDKVVSKETPATSFFMKMPSATPVTSEEPETKHVNIGVSTEDEEENDDEASKENAFTPVMESDSLCSVRCKVFVKKDSSEPSDTPYQNLGVGMLFVKPVSPGKVQIVVRADNSLGNIILNVCITSEMPVQIASKNTLMLVCCPMPGEPPRTVLIRVKNEDEVNLLHSHLVSA